MEEFSIFSILIQVKFHYIFSHLYTCIHFTEGHSSSPSSCKHSEKFMHSINKLYWVCHIFRCTETFLCECFLMYLILVLWVLPCFFNFFLAQGNKVIKSYKCVKVYFLPKKNSHTYTHSFTQPHTRTHWSNSHSRKPIYSVVYVRKKNLTPSASQRENVGKFK